MSVDMHERRAERGTHRGAANVWTNAQPEVAPASEPAGSWMFRLVLGLWLCIAVGAVVLASTRGSEVDAEDGGVAQAQEEELGEDIEDDDLPLPILIEGMTLNDVIAPCTIEGGLECDEDRSVFLGIAPCTIEGGLECDEDRSVFLGSEDFDPELGVRTPTILIFGDQQSPFTGPVVGVETFDGGFRTWTLNVEEEEADELVSQIIRVDDTWQLPESTGLVEVERFEESTDPGPLWQLDFSGDGSATLQPLRAIEDEMANGWEWIVPLVRLADFGPTVDFAMVSLEPVEVLGIEGVAIVEPFLSNEGEVVGTRVASTVWADDSYAYRLIADSPLENDEAIDRLVLVNREAWEEALIDAWFDEGAEALGVLAALAFTVIAAFMILWFLYKRRWLSIVIVLVAMFAVYALLSFPSIGFGLLVGFGGLALAAFVGRKPQVDQPPPPPRDAEVLAAWRPGEIRDE